MYTSISGDPSQCSNIQPLSAFDPGSAAFTFITPNQQNDMHDGSVQQGDEFLRSFVPQIVGNRAFSDGGLLFITFDEGKGQGGRQGDAGGHVPTLIIRPGMPTGYRASAYYDHYSLLRTVEDAFGLPCLGSSCSRDPIAY